MNHRAVSQIFFNDIFSVPVEHAAQASSSVPPHPGMQPEPLVNAVTTGYLMTMLESLCAREIQPYIDHDEEIAVGSSIHCRHHGPISPGALVKVDGWVTRVDKYEMVFRVQASDEQEIVCEGEISFAVVGRAQLENRKRRKTEAIARRQLFAGA